MIKTELTDRKRGNFRRQRIIKKQLPLNKLTDLSMKKVMFALLGLAAVVSSAACYAQKGEPKVIAHRGFWKAEPKAPHNSIESLENAVALGCFGTEFDIWLTADDIPVVFHDRKTAKGVDIQKTTYAELMEKDGFLANGEKIPTLDEYLATWKRSNKKVKLIFEIKSHDTPERDRTAAEVVHGIAKKHKIKAKQMEYIAFSRNVCKALRDIKCGVPVAYLNGDLSPADARQELGVTGIDYHMSVFRKNPEWIEQAQTLGMVVNVWTVNSDEDLRYFIEAGADYITTDRPDRLMEILPQHVCAKGGAAAR